VLHNPGPGRAFIARAALSCLPLHLPPRFASSRRGEKTIFSTKQVKEFFERIFPTLDSSLFMLFSVRFSLKVSDENFLLHQKRWWPWDAARLDVHFATGFSTPFLAPFRTFCLLINSSFVARKPNNYLISPPSPFSSLLMRIQIVHELFK
jgi:hypothetical protein